VTGLTKNTNSIPNCFFVRWCTLIYLRLRTTLRIQGPLPCVTTTLVETRQGCRFAQAALKLCVSLEQRRDLETCPTFMSLNAALVACCTSMRRTRQHDCGSWHCILHQWEGAFVQTAIKKWHKRGAEALAKQSQMTRTTHCLFSNTSPIIVEKRHQIILRDALENAPVSRLPRA